MMRNLILPFFALCGFLTQEISAQGCHCINKDVASVRTGGEYFVQYFVKNEILVFSHNFQASWNLVWNILLLGEGLFILDISSGG